MRKFIPLYQQFEERVADLKGSVYADDTILTYRQLNSRANRLARYLRDHGVCKGDAVAILLDHSVLIPEAVLAIHKAGAHYVPLSKSSPASYHRQILEDANCKAVVSDCPFDIDRWQAIDISQPGRFDHLSEENTGTEVSPEDTAYILFTSGSTGKPKGVIISHGNLAYYLRWFVDVFMPQLGGVPAFTSGLRFAASVTQLFAPLLTGHDMVMFPPGTITDPKALFEQFAAFPGTGLYIVPTLWQEHLNYARGRSVSAPAFVLLSGERVTDKLKEDSFACFPDVPFWNLYGPTETVANICYEKLSKHRAVTIGRVLEGSEALVAGVDGKKTEGSGELLVHGPGVFSGYLNRPELNRKVFVEINGKTYYRTGDLVKPAANGKFSFLGRKDRQIKWNGVRIELEALEDALLRIPGISRAVVLPVDFGDYRQTPVAFVERSGSEPGKREINEVLAQRFPTDNLPPDIVFYERFPTLPNGKADLKSMTGKYKLAKTAIATRFNGIDSELAHLISEIALIDVRNQEDDILEAGVNSMAVIRLLNRINSRYNTAITLAEFYANSRFDSLVSLIGKRQREQPQVQEIQEPEFYPVAFNQKALWIADQTRETQNAYNIMVHIDLVGKGLSFERIEEALRSLIHDEKILRSVFAEHQGTLMRRVVDSSEVDIVKIPLKKDENPEGYLKRYDTGLLKETGKPPVRLIVFGISPDSFRVTLIAHHIIFDGISTGIFGTALIKKLENNPSATSGQYGKFVQEQLRKAANNDFDEGLLFWENELRDADTFLGLPTDFPRPARQDYGGDVVVYRTGNQFKNRLENFCKAHKITPFRFLLGAYSLLLHKITDRDSLLVAFPFANRQSEALENAIGYFTNVVLFKSKVSGDETLLGYLSDADARLRGSMPFWEVPLEMISSRLEVRTDPAFNPLYQAMFAFHEPKPRGISPSGFHYQITEAKNRGAKFDLFLEVQESDSDLELRFNYATALFSRQRAEKFVDYFLRIADYLLTQPNGRFKDLTLIDQAGKDAIERWNATTREYDGPMTLFALFESACKRYPDHTAVESPSGSCTYAELYRDVEKYARVLSGAGISKARPVGIRMQPGRPMLIAILALARSGVPYVPLDPNYPKARIHQIIKASGLKTVICEQHEQDKWAEDLVFDLPPDETAGMQPAQSAGEDDLLYIMFTSGSTGTPKGVPVANKGVANYLKWFTEEYAIGVHDKFLHQTSINFDISVLELFSPLITGGTLVFSPPEEVKIWDKVIATMKEKKITLVQYVPSAIWGLLAHLDSCRELNLRILFSGGEELTEELRNRILAKLDCRLVNLYGPTEASIYVSGMVCNSTAGPVYIGKPIYNMKMHILDKYLNPVPVGETGEIYLSGIGVVKGYLNNEEQTRKRFVANKFTGERMFRTGDKGRYAEDGNIEYLGREDMQVKIRGFRIELNEIAHEIRKIPEVEEAVAMVHEKDPTDKRIVACYTLKPGAIEIGKDHVRKRLKETLPVYMLPSEIVRLDKMRYLPNGKVDKKGLLNQLNRIRMINKRKDIFRESVIESKIRSIWEKVLGHADFGLSDNFFDVGGHSLLLLQLKETIEKDLNKKISLTELYKHTNVRSMAQTFIRQWKEKNVIPDIKSRAAMRKQVPFRRRRP